MSTTALAADGPAAPSAHVRAALTWLVIYPLMTATFLLARPVVGDLPLPLQTLVVTLLVVPAAVYLGVPAALRARAAIVGRRAARAGAR